jgi:hypothetical protein
MRTKTYLAFDGSTDLMSYRTIQSWDADDSSFSLNDAHDVNYVRDGSLPESIINQLRQRLELSKNLALIIGAKTMKNRKGILKYELNYAIRNKLPIFLFFKGFDSSIQNDETLWNNKLYPQIPSAITNSDTKYCLVCPFTKKAFSMAAKNYSNNTLPSEGYNWYWK